MRVLITGVSGFSGSALAGYFLNNGHKVIGTVRDMSSPRLTGIKDDPKMTIYKADLSKSFELPYDCDVLIHTAAQAAPKGVPVSDYIDSNIIATKNICEYALSSGIKQVFYFSSMSVYGQTRDSVITEETVLCPNDPYGMSKLYGEYIFSEASDRLPSISMRLPGVIGKGSNGPWLAKVLAKIRAQEDIKIFNAESLFNNGVHILNIAAFIEKLMNNDIKESGVVNIACSEPLSVEHTVRTMIKAVGSESKVEVGPSSGIPYVISTEKISSVHGFVPMKLEDALLEFCKENVLG